MTSPPCAFSQVRFGPATRIVVVGLSLPILFACLGLAELALSGPANSTYVTWYRRFDTVQLREEDFALSALASGYVGWFGWHWIGEASCRRGRVSAIASDDLPPVLALTLPVESLPSARWTSTKAAAERGRFERSMERGYALGWPLPIVLIRSTSVDTAESPNRPPTSTRTWRLLPSAWLASSSCWIGLMLLAGSISKRVRNRWRQSEKNACIKCGYASFPGAICPECGEAKRGDIRLGSQ